MMLVPVPVHDIARRRISDASQQRMEYNWTIAAEIESSGSAPPEQTGNNRHLNIHTSRESMSRSNGTRSIVALLALCLASLGAWYAHRTWTGSVPKEKEK